jgi:hypothetical protein
MKFLGTLAFGFSTIAAMIAALLSFGFQVKVESPISPQQIAKDQQLSQCTAALSQTGQQLSEAQSKVQGLETRLKESVLIADQTAARVSAEIAQGVRLASEKTAAAGTSTSIVTGVGVGLLMFPLGFLFGRHRRSGEPAALTARVQEALAVPAPREPINALPLYDPRHRGAGQQTGALR